MDDPTSFGDILGSIFSKLWSLGGIFSEWISWEGGSGEIENTDWQSYYNSLHPTPQTSGRMLSYSVQGDPNAYNSLNSSSAYSYSSLSDAAQLSAPTSLLDAFNNYTTIFDGPQSYDDPSSSLSSNTPMGPFNAYSNTSMSYVSPASGSPDTSDWLAANDAPVTPDSQNRVDANGITWIPVPDGSAADAVAEIVLHGWAGLPNVDGATGAALPNSGAAPGASAAVPTSSDPWNVGAKAGPTVGVAPNDTTWQPSQSPDDTDAPPIQVPVNARGGYTIAPPPGVSSPGTYNFIPPLFVWSQFQSAKQEMTNPNNSAGQRALNYGLASAAAPAAYFEEGLRDALNYVTDTAIRAGENVARAQLWAEQDEYAEAAEDTLFAIAGGTAAFVKAVQTVQPVANAIENAFPGPNVTPNVPGTGSNTTSEPGRWLYDFQGGQNMSSEASAYEMRVAEKPEEGMGYYVGTTQFDGYIDGVLIDAKYWQSPGQIVDALEEGAYWAGNKVVGQAVRQLSAAGDTPIEWRVASQEGVDAINSIFEAWGFDIKVTYVP